MIMGSLTLGGLWPEIVSDRALLDQDRYGIEIEFEHVSALSPNGDGFNLKHWMAKPDGSLRNSGMEFVTRPMANHAAHAALTELYNPTRGTWFEATQRCGMHVHTQVTSWSIERFRKFITWYLCNEMWMFETAGVVRSTNIFCVPWNHTPYVLDRVLWLLRRLQYLEGTPSRIDNMLDTRNPDLTALHFILSDDFFSMMKYSALNLHTMGRLGTIEFRHAPAYQEFHRALEWFTTIRSAVESVNDMSFEEILYTANDTKTPGVSAARVHVLTDEQIVPTGRHIQNNHREYPHGLIPEEEPQEHREVVQDDYEDDEFSEPLRYTVRNLSNSAPEAPTGAVPTIATLPLFTVSEDSEEF